MHFVKYRFFDRTGGVSEGDFTSLNCAANVGDDINNVIINRKIIKNSFLDQDGPFFVRQVHSGGVFYLENYQQLHLTDKVEADAIVTNLQNVLIGITTADCIPVLLYNKKIVAAIHASWRSMFSDIISNTIKLINDIEKNGELTAIIGPGIAVEFYEVQNDFYQQWITKSDENKKYFSYRKASMYFDLVLMVYEVLVANGVKTINCFNTDTFSNSDYFSYRRAMKKSSGICGRNTSVISIINTSYRMKN